MSHTRHNSQSKMKSPTSPSAAQRTNINLTNYCDEQKTSSAILPKNSVSSSRNSSRVITENLAMGEDATVNSNQ